MNKSIVLFDGNCNFCKASVKFLERNDSKHKLSYIALDSVEARAQLKNAGVTFVQKNTIYFVHQNKVFIKSTAVLKALSLLRFPVSLLSVFLIVPKFIRDGVYSFIAKHRHQF